MKRYNVEADGSISKHGTKDGVVPRVTASVSQFVTATVIPVPLVPDDDFYWLPKRQGGTS